MSTLKLVFPHQLFEQIPFTESKAPILLIEEALFFRQYAFHQQKLAFHRASMQFYAQYLQQQGFEVTYIEAIDPRSDIRQLIPDLARQGVRSIDYIDPTDDWLERRLKRKTKEFDIELHRIDSPLFLNTQADLLPFFRADKKKFFLSLFYIEQRKKQQILLRDAEHPFGGIWSLDEENRKKYPRKKTPPVVVYPEVTTFYEEARQYVKTHFDHCPGELGEQPWYPINFEQSKAWLQQFLEQRFLAFGPYEDAMVMGQSILHHSVLSPLINVGLLSPQLVVQQSLAFAQTQAIPLNSTEGFIRQIIGWREFIRGVYECKGREERTKNFWGFQRKLPSTFYDGTTGILPLDLTIKTVLKTGYCHHIERLMVLGNFMLLCEFDPDAVYQWFMELFIDAYDWVMVPNVYGMSQFADGGLMSTKPYISGSNYLLKMSNFPKGDWQNTWDALFWRFLHVHRSFFLKNPRLGMLIRSFDKMPIEKQNRLLETAEAYLKQLE
ncbi:MAG: cryptochrome/photolyase family protein [Bacteroidota bacterium]